MMAVAFDAFSTGSSLGDLSYTHTPVGTPRCVIVFVVVGGATTDTINGVTYGGVTMTEVTGSPNVQASGTDSCPVHCFFLGASIPTGAQTVFVDAASGGCEARTITLTASADTTVQDSDGTINSTSQANPSVTLSLGGNASFCAIQFSSGQDAVSGITPLSGWTSRNETDHGAFTSGCYTYDTIGTTDVTAGWTQTADDAVAIAVAITEAAGATPFTPPNVTAPSTLRTMNYGR